MKPFSYIFFILYGDCQTGGQILGAQSNGKPNFLLDYPQNFEIWAKTWKICENVKKHKKS